MSNREIRQLIEDKNISPILNETAMVKYFTYDGDSWIGYDDEETYAMKQALYVSMIRLSLVPDTNHISQLVPTTVALAVS